MGTPRASASLDQMSNVQNSASRGGEFADGAVASSRNCSAPASQVDKGSAEAKQIVFCC
jgi:hypothetical protein